MPDAAFDPLGIDWIAAMRRIVARQHELFAAAPTIAARSHYEGIGAGGDHTLVIDRECEDVVFEELDALCAAHPDLALTVISEERGTVDVGTGDPGGWQLVVDPIDGSLNTRRLLPSHSLSIALASGGSMADVELGYVYDFGASEELVAWRGRGAELNGEAIRASQPPPGDVLDLIGVESAEPTRLWPLVQGLGSSVNRIRVIGSLAMMAGYVAAGRFDAMVTTHPCRSVDIAAAQLIVREAGGLIEMDGPDLSAVSLGLDARYLVLAGATAEALGTMQAAVEHMQSVLLGSESQAATIGP